MKGTESMRHIPVLSSRRRGAGQRGALHRAGASDYLTKPINASIRRRINASLAAKRLHDVEQES